MTSVITVSTNKSESLNNLLDGIALGTEIPREVIIIDMTGKVEVLKEYNFMIKVQRLKSPNKTPSIAEAFNLGARLAWEENLVFLSASTIPNPDFIEKMEEHLLCASGLIMSEPRYLTRSIELVDGNTKLFENSSYYSGHPELNKELTPCFDPFLFSASGFGIRKDLFTKIEGFDETFLEYDVVETDFAFKLRKEKIDYYLARNVLFHQENKMETPPSHHLETIVRNSNLFYKKWGVWPVTKALEHYANNGLIKWNGNKTETIEILKDPNDNPFDNENHESLYAEPNLN